MFYYRNSGLARLLRYAGLETVVLASQDRQDLTLISWENILCYLLDLV